MEPINEKTSHDRHKRLVQLFRPNSIWQRIQRPITYCPILDSTPTTNPRRWYRFTAEFSLQLHVPTQVVLQPDEPQMAFVATPNPGVAEAATAANVHINEAK